MKVKKTDKKLRVEEQKQLILGILIDFIEGSDEDLLSFFEHVGFDLTCINSAEELSAAFLGFFRLSNGEYDADRACNSLATWPPIAARIAFIKGEQKGSANDL